MFILMYNSISKRFRGSEFQSCQRRQLLTLRLRHYTCSFYLLCSNLGVLHILTYVDCASRLYKLNSAYNGIFLGTGALIHDPTQFSAQFCLQVRHWSKRIQLLNLAMPSLVSTQATSPPELVCTKLTCKSYQTSSHSPKRSEDEWRTNWQTTNLAPKIQPGHT